MTEARYHELLGQLLDGVLSEAEAEEMRQELERDPSRLHEVREHLMFSDLLAQEHSPHRTAESFWRTLQTRLDTDANAPVHEAAQRSPSPIKPPGRLKRGYMIVGIAAALLISITVASQWPRRNLGQGNTPQPAPGTPGLNSGKATLVSLHGEVVCAHCILHQTEECQPAVRVREQGHEQTFFLSDNAISRDFNRKQGCGRTPAPAPLRVLAEGLVHTENGRSLLAATRLEVQR